MKITCSNLIPHFVTIGRISLKTKNVSDVEISDGHTDTGKHTNNTKIYNEEATDKLQFLEDKKSNVNLIKKLPENNQT